WWLNNLCSRRWSSHRSGLFNHLHIRLTTLTEHTSNDTYSLLDWLSDFLNSFLDSLFDFLTHDYILLNTFRIDPSCSCTQRETHWQPLRVASANTQRQTQGAYIERGSMTILVISNMSPLWCMSLLIQRAT